MTKNNVRKSVLEKVLAVFAWVSFVIAIITILFSVFSSFSSEKNGKEIFGVKFLIVARDSMSLSTVSEGESELFNAGDLIILKTTTDNSNFKVGDIIAFVSYNPDSYGQTLTRKICEVNYSISGQLIGYTTYDINSGVSGEELVAPSSIIGQYSGKIAKLGNFFADLKTPTGNYLSILIPTVLLMFFCSITLGKYMCKKEALMEKKNAKKFDELQTWLTTLEEKYFSIIEFAQGVKEEDLSDKKIEDITE